MSIDYANIMLLGRTGVGKSSFINYLVGANVSKTGTGMPVTQDFDTYQFENVSGIPLCIYDSKGLEVMDYQTIRENIIDFAACRCNDDDVANWIHTIFYCVNAASQRVEPDEINLIKNLRGQISQSIHVIITHCKDTEEGRSDSSEMARFIRDKLDDTNVHIYCVNSVAMKKRSGTVEQFGRKEILDQIFKLLWSDISHKVAREYAVEFRSGLLDISQNMRSTLHDAANRFRPTNIVKAAINDTTDNYLDLIEEHLKHGESEHDAIRERLDARYEQKAQRLADFCNRYGSAMGQPVSFNSVWDSFEDLTDFDVEEIMNICQLGQYMNDLDENPEGFFDTAGYVFKAVGGLLSIRKLVTECCDRIVAEFVRRIPSVEEIEQRVYESLMIDIE